MKQILLLLSAVPLLILSTSNSEAKIRHKAAPGQIELNSGGKLPSTASKPPVPRKVQATEPASPKSNANTQQAGGEAYVNPSGKCLFSTADFGLWKIRRLLVQSDRSIYFVASSEAERGNQSSLLHLDIASKKVTPTLPAAVSVRDAALDPAGKRMAAVESSSGVWISKDQSWEKLLADQQVFEFKWAGQQEAFITRKGENGFILSKWKIAGGEPTNIAHSTKTPFRLLDVSPSTNQVAFVKGALDTKSELYVYEDGKTRHLPTNSRVLQAAFTKDERNLFVLEDIDGNGAVLRLYSLKTNSAPRAVSAEKLPAAQLSLSADRLALSLETQDWGLPHVKLFSIDASGTRIGEWPLTPDARASAHETVVYAEGTNMPRAIAAVSSLEKADHIVLFDRGNSKTLWEQKDTQGCVQRWHRQAVTAPDKTDFIVDIYEPRAPDSVAVKAQQKIVIHVPRSSDHPPRPLFASVRQYWLQNGWTVVEPHLRGSREVGTHFIQAAQSSTWEDDILEVVKQVEPRISNTKTPSPIEKREILSEKLLVFRALAINGKSPYAPYSINKACENCSALELARALQKD
jgi:hypothetical protein